MRRLCGVIALSLLARISGGQTVLVLDLGTETAGSPTTESVRPGTYGVRIDSRVPTVSYTVSVIVRIVDIPPLPNVAAAVTGILSNRTSCPPIDASIKALGAAYQQTSEREVKKAVDQAVAAIESTADCELEKTVLRGLIEQSRYNWSKNIVLAAGQELVITVVRASKDAGGSAQTWRKTFTTGPRGEWRATYGFAVAFTRLGAGSGVFAQQNSAFLETVGATTKIGERRDRGGADLVPAVLFHFMPADRESQRVVPGMSAGVSFDGTNPSVMGGYGWTYQQNVNLSFGLIGRKEPVLLAKYAVGQTVPADLDESQLTEMKLRIRPYVMLTFRFATSPFSSGDNGKDTATEVAKDSDGNR